MHELLGKKSIGFLEDEGDIIDKISLVAFSSPLGDTFGEDSLEPLSV